MKKDAKRMISCAVALTLLLSVVAVPAMADESTLPVGATRNMSDDTPEGQISLADVQSFKTMIPVNYDVDVDAVEWSLDRDDTKEYLDPESYPTQFAGADITEWGCYKEADIPWISNIETTLEETGGKTYLTLTFDTAMYFVGDVSVPQINGGDFMDVCGYFDLVASVDGDAIGSSPVKIVPYDTFNTMDEIYAHIDAMEIYAAANTDLYVEQFSMGTSTDGFDMPYLIISDSKASVSEWLAYADAVETDPTSVLADLEDGTYDDLRVPVVFSNIHANEYAATDGLVEFGWTLLEAAASTGAVSYTNLVDFTDAGVEKLAEQMEEDSLAIPDLVADTATYMGYLHADSDEDGYFESQPVDLEKYYVTEEVVVDVADLLSDVFYILVPEQNVEGREYMTRTSSNGYDLNRDNSFQITPETQNMQKLIGTYNPVSITELHGRVETFQCEPCDPPHEPNFEYDLLSNHLMTAGEAFGIAAVANNNYFNSYVIPQRDYLIQEDDGSTYWADPWDDMSTSYTPQFAMLHGTVGYTVELPAHSDETVDAVQYGCLGQSVYIADEKIEYLLDQAKIYERGVTNFNSNDYDLVGQWFADQYDEEGAESEIFRPTFDGEDENGNFYPECYIIPMDGENQKNLQAAYDMMEWLTRNDVKVNLTTTEITVDGVTYPKGTLIVSMYQAKRSVANGALYDGSLLNYWTVLYSEGITTFNETRGFDMATIAQPAVYEAIDAVCGADMDYAASLAYLNTLSGSFSGIINKYVVISNASLDSTAAVNALLDAGKEVSMITDENSQYYGDFLCTYFDYTSIDDKFVITATGVPTNLPGADVIEKSPLVYVTGERMDLPAGGYIDVYKNSASYTWSYDCAALEMMGFEITQDASKADVILGGSALDDAALAAVQSGTPYLAYSSAAAATYADLFDAEDLTRSSAEGMDCLGSVVYPETNLINASYVMEGDSIMYGYGVGYFSAVPEDATILVQMDGSKAPTEGFIKAITDEQGEKMETYLNDSIQAFSYVGLDKDGNLVDVTAFANTLTQKVHQQDEFGFISNFAFSSLLVD